MGRQLGYAALAAAVFATRQITFSVMPLPQTLFPVREIFQRLITNFGGSGFVANVSDKCHEDGNRPEKKGRGGRKSGETGNAA